MEAETFRIEQGCCLRICSGQNLVSWDMHERRRMNLQWLNAPQNTLSTVELCLLRRPRAVVGNPAEA